MSNPGPASTITNNSTVGQSGVPLLVGVSRALGLTDNGQILECSATVTLTVPTSLGNFGCTIIPSGTTSIASAGVTLLNGATTTVTRTAASNFIFAIIARASAADSYVVTGA